ncbi:MAG: hydroxyisourate hydrolase, partial [Rhodobacteraceae bacterium]|nr:hydroxyisourate hydrolase [Paracoccaceae bacterium]
MKGLAVKGFLTTHVLDTARGQPAAGLRIVLSRVTTNGNMTIRGMTTHSEGRTESPTLTTED